MGVGLTVLVLFRYLSGQIGTMENKMMIKLVLILSPLLRFPKVYEAADCASTRLANDTFREGETARLGSFFFSSNGRYRASFQCTGNLIVTADHDDKTELLWSSRTSKQKPTKFFLANEGSVLALADDYDVIVKSFSFFDSAADTQLENDECSQRAHLKLDNDGVLVIIRCGKVEWTSADKTSGSCPQPTWNRVGFSRIELNRVETCMFEN